MPALARRLYDEGRAAFDRGAYVAAVERFTRALPAIEALAMDGQREMEDLRVLTSGFLSLARDRVAPPATPRPPRLASRAWPVETVTLAPGPANADLDPQTTPPVAIEQDLPSWVPDQYGVGAGMNSAIDVRIDETGRVVDVTLVTSAHPRYDFELMRAARNWRYEPARRAGLPVASQKRVEVVLRAR
ncbi:MAG: energy transducer TonB [Acidobacteria bacterium]|nr:energy transducer TonB [Acidobacteriota bacterium]